MRRLFLLGIVSALGGSALGQSVNLYAPVRSIKDQGISVRGWGSGTIAETDELAYEGTFSIRVSTRNFFQGGILSFANPVDLSGIYGDRSNLLRILFRVADSSLTLGGGGSGGRPPGLAGLGGGGAGEGAVGGPPGRGGLQGGGPPGGIPGGARGPATSSNAETTLRNIRVIVTTSDGKKSEAYVPVNTGGSGDRGWTSVAVPLQAINGLGESNKMVTEVALSGDAVTTFYVGDIKTVNDTTPISGEANYRDLNLALGDEIELIGRGFGGSSILKYHWDFDATDGIQVDAEGQVVKRKFRKAGSYTITLTIMDIFGLKQPYKTTLNVKVNP